MKDSKTRAYRAIFFIVLVSIAALSCKKSTSSGGSNPPSGNNVSIGDDFFNPQTKVVTAGTSVTWTYNGSGTHSVTSDPPSTELNSSDLKSTNKIYTHTFITADTFYYHCKYHGTAGNGSSFGTGMVGRIIVQ